MSDAATKLWRKMKKTLIIGALFTVSITVVYQIGNLLVCDYYIVCVQEDWAVLSGSKDRVLEIIGAYCIRSIRRRSRIEAAPPYAK